MPYSTTQLNEVVKELLDAKIQASFDHNCQTLKKFKKEAVTEETTSRGRDFVITLTSNQSYGSQASEGAAFPVAGNLTRDRANITYRSQFASFDFTGDVEDLRNKRTLQDEVQAIVKDTMEQFDEVQNFFLFGDGNGVLGVIDSIASNDITMLNTVANSYGARFIRRNQRLNAYDQSGAAYRTGDMVVTGVNRTTDVVTVDSAAAAIANDDDDVLVFEDSYGFAPYGLKYHVSDTGTWLGLNRATATYSGLRSLVYDAASASVDFDMIEAGVQQSKNLRGDMAPEFDFKLIMHPVQHRYLRALARSSGNVQFNAALAGNKKMDLIVQSVSPGGMEICEDSWCAPSDIWGLRMADWAIEEVTPRQLYKHSSGDVFIQSLASGPVYKDVKEGRVYWRYNIVCKAPYRQIRWKNVNFSTSDTRIQRP